MKFFLAGLQAGKMSQPQVQSRVLRSIVPAIAAMLFFFVSVGFANAACHVVTPSGSGSFSGADWNNAIAGIPKTFVRGDSYYFADGIYGNLTVSTADSGTLVITLKKARRADHCTDVGYQDSTMGTGQASFTHIEPTTDYWTFDGVDSTSSTTGHGFYVNGTLCTISSCWDVVLNSVKYITFRYIMVQGMGDGGTDVHIDENFRCLTSPNISLLYSYIYNSSGAPVVMRGCNNFVMDHTWLYHNRSTSTNHAEGISDSGSSSAVISNSAFWDIEGTAVITELNAGTVSSADNWQIFGNLFFYSPNNANARKGYGNGVIAVINNQEASNWYIYNNTVANITSAMTLNVRVDFSASTGSVRYVYNNLWYNCAQANHFGNPAADYNTYLNTDPKTSDMGSHTVIQTSGASNPFVNISNKDFHLAASTANGASSASSLTFNNHDPDGITRGSGGIWDRGVYEFTAGSVQAPAPPTALQAIVN
jgi:hypothetical protein